MKKLLLAVTQNPFLQGSVILSVGSILANVFTYLFNTILARFVSVADYGEYLAALSYLMVLLVPLSIINLLIIQRIANRQKLERQAYSDLLIQKVWRILTQFSPVVFLFGLFIGWLIFLVSSLQVFSVLFIFGMIAVYFFSTIFSAVFQAQKQFLTASAFVLGIGAAKLLAVVSLFVLPPTLVVIYTFMVVSQLVMLWLVWQKVRPESVVVAESETYQQSSWQMVIKVLTERKTVLSLLTLFGLLMMINVDVMIAKRSLSSGVAGYYAALNLLVKIIFYVASPLTSVAFSYFSDAEAESQRHRILALALLAVGIISISAFTGYSLLSLLVVQVVFGQTYQPIAAYLMQTAAFGGVYIVANLLGHYWLARQSPLSIASLLVVLVQIYALLTTSLSLDSILNINLMAAAGLTCFYSLGFVAKWRSYRFFSPREKML